jgi:hypothetical protein
VTRSVSPNPSRASNVEAGQIDPLRQHLHAACRRRCRLVATRLVFHRERFASPGHLARFSGPAMQKGGPGLCLCWDCSAPRRIPSITLKVCSGSRATRVIACDRRRAFAQETETATLRADRFDQLLCLQICLRAEMSNSSESLGWLFSTALDNRSAPTIPLSSAIARCRASRLSPLIRAANISR